MFFLYVYILKRVNNKMHNSVKNYFSLNYLCVKKEKKLSNTTNNILFFIFLDQI